MATDRNRVSKVSTKVDNDNSLLTSHAVVLGCRKGGRIHVDNTARGEGVVVLFGEVVEPIFVLRQQVETIQLRCSIIELSDQTRVTRGINSDGDRREENCR